MRIGKVIWSEGMHLGPQHFQMQSRYFESLLEMHANALEHAPHGLLHFDVDDTALRDGVLALRQAVGIWPDGLPFRCPGADLLPPPRCLDEIGRPNEHEVVVSLAVHPAGCGPPTARFARRDSSVPDLTVGRDEQSVATAMQQTFFARPGEASEALSVPIIEMVRQAGGGWRLRESFYGPCLRLSAAPPLVRALDDLLELLRENARRAPHPRELAPGTHGYSARGIGQAWFLHTVNSALASLRQVRESATAHPEHLYRQLARLAGQLCTFGLDASPADLPLYDHARPEHVFAALFAHIRAHLNLVTPTNSVSIPLKPGERYFYSGEIADMRWVTRSRWYLAMKAGMGDSDLIDAVPRLLKLCSRDFVPKLVERALPGLKLRHTALPPPAISPRLDRQYFEIDQAGPCWERLVQTRTLGIYIPGEFDSPQPEVLAMWE